MQNNPNSIKGSIKLKSLSDPNINRDAYINGFIDLASVEPSLGVPTGTTNTIVNSSYYFPVVGIDPYYGNSRKFTGDDSLVLKNGNLGYNNPNPKFNFDINGNLQSSTGNIASKLSSSNLNVKNVQGFKDVQLNSYVGANNNSIFNIISAQNVVVPSMTAVSTLNVIVPTNILRSITLTNSGNGYEFAPTISVIGNYIIQATATASLNTLNGSISSITITNPGIGYTSNPSIQFTTTQTSSYGITSISVKDISNNYYYTGFTKSPIISAYKGLEYKSVSATAILGSPTSTTLSSTVTSINILNTGYGYGYNLTPSIKLSSNIITTIPVTYISFGNVLSAATATGSITANDLSSFYNLNDAVSNTSTLSNAFIQNKLYTPYLSANQTYTNGLTSKYVTVKSNLLSNPSINLFPYSEIFRIWDTSSGCFIYDNYSLSPNNTQTASLVKELSTNPANTSPRIGTNVTVSDINQIYTFSVYVSSNGQRYTKLDFRDTDVAAFNFGEGIVRATFDLQSGTIIDNSYSYCSNVGLNASITSAGNNWYRISLSGNCKTTTVDAPVGKKIRIRIFSGQDDGHVSNPVNGGIFVWGAQLEISKSPSSYVKTVNNVSSYGVYANNLHGKIDIDPYYFYYNDKNKLSSYSNKNLTLGVKPSDPYSTEDTSVTRTLDGNCGADVTNTANAYQIYKPFFKNLQGVINYVANKGLEGNNLSILVFENIVEGEDTNKALNPNASGVYLNQSAYGNVAGGYYSTEWLGTNYPELTSNGILGGHFYWGKNNEGSWGTIYHLGIGDIKFNSIYINGMFEIGSKINSDKSKRWDTRKPFDAAPPVVSIRSYFCANSSRRFGEFGLDASERVYNFSRTRGADPKSWIRPFNINFSGKFSMYNMGFEFAHNASDATSIWFQSKTKNTAIGNTTIAMKGPGVFYYTPLLYQNLGSLNYIIGTRQMDPFHLDQWQWEKNLWSAIPGASDPTYYPGYGLAVVGNDGKSTFQRDATLSNLAAVAFMPGPTDLWVIDQGQNIGPIGKDSPVQSSIILDGNIYTTCFHRVYRGSGLIFDNQIYKTSNFVLSSFNSQVDNNTKIISPNYNSKTDFLPIIVGGGRDAFNNIYWRWVPTKSWNVLQNNNSLTYTDYNSLLAINNNEQPSRFNTSTKTFDYTDYIKSYSGFVSQGGNNYNTNQIKADKSNGPRTISYVNFDQLSAYNTQGLYTQTSPLCSTFTSTMQFWTPPTR